jgi:hypothetical protein
MNQQNKAIDFVENANELAFHLTRAKEIGIKKNLCSFL